MRVRGALALLLLAALPLAARAQRGTQQQNPQQELGESQRRLQEIRAERGQLRRELDRIRGQVHDVSAEVRNIQRQQAVSSELLKELNFQLTEMQTRIEETTTELLDTQDRLEQKKALLNLRLREIYKRGPLQSEEVLLSARSFSDLLNRYKYLYLVATRDRRLVREVGELHRQLALREVELRRSYTDLQFLQNERAQENAELASLGASRGQTLTSLQRHERNTSRRIDELLRDERRLSGLIATLETRRREAERRERERVAAAERERRTAASAPAGSRGATPPPPASATVNRTPAPTMTTADVGNLSWPVGGSLLYRFGRAVQSNGTAIRNNGVGIGAPAGSPVRAVEAGTVEMAAPFEGYGPTVVVSHGGGYYSLYLYLKDVNVRQGQAVAKGQQVGTVGGEGTPQGAHVEFQIRAPGGEAVDPLTWLRRQGA